MITVTLPHGWNFHATGKPGWFGAEKDGVTMFAESLPKLAERIRHREAAAARREEGRESEDRAK